jgi:predicted hotdog family 3-hydroxylacyl-ACP dehydratase
MSSGVSAAPLLPLRAERLLPHRPPMLCIDELFACTEDGASASARLHEGHILLDADGHMEPVGFIELAAQCAGAARGFRVLKEGGERGPGFLAGVRDFSVFAPACVGDTLVVHVCALSELEGVRLLEARIYRGDELLAGGKIKVFEPGG